MDKMVCKNNKKNKTLKKNYYLTKYHEKIVRKIAAETGTLNQSKTVREAIEHYADKLGVTLDE